MPAANRNDPYKNYNFLVEIDGATVAGFSECTGISSEVDIIEYREGGDFRTRKLPGLAKFGDITLKRGVTQSLELYNWHRDVLRGQVDRKTGVIILLDDTRAPVARWVFRDAFPKKYEGPRLNAKGSDVAIETLVICCESMEREE
jgi:phage tail-like protein